ncbi:MAG: NADH-quinone oxidoreductase subunit N [Bacteroidia bacterium]|nr:MAG: NADH-quinone oxidoreductase subunit N [Bacteroidia bacterium]
MILLFDFTDWQSVIFEALPYLIPEYLLIFGIACLVIFSAFPRTYIFLPYFASLILVLEIFFIPSPSQTFFRGIIQHSYFYEKISFIGLLGSLLTLIFSQITLKKHLKPEYIIYILAGQLGLQILGLSQNWILSFIGFELISFVGYLLVVTFKESPSASESAIKYFLYGACSSGIMLYGVSLYYGIHGNIMLGNEWKFSDLEKMALGLILIGIFFKLSVFPLHFWAPEVYHGAPAATGAWLSTVSKLAGITLFYAIFKNSIPKDFQYALWIIAIITMFTGNLGILRQNHIYRLMGYSSIAHSGFLLMNLAIFQNTAQATVLFYSLFSLPITFLAFYSAYYFSQIADTSDFTLWNGLGKLYPLLASFFMIALAGLIGLPPTVGFIAKLYLVLPVWKEYHITQNPLIVFVLVAFVINTLLAFAAYSRIAIQLLLRSPNTSGSERLPIFSIIGILWSIIVLLFGVYGFDKILQLLI